MLPIAAGVDSGSHSRGGSGGQQHWRLASYS